MLLPSAFSMLLLASTVSASPVPRRPSDGSCLSAEPNVAALGRRRSSVLPDEILGFTSRDLHARDDAQVVSTPVTFSRNQDPRVMGGARPGSQVLTKTDVTVVASDSAPIAEVVAPAVATNDAPVTNSRRSVSARDTVTIAQDPRIVGGSEPNAPVLKTDTKTVATESKQANDASLLAEPEVQGHILGRASASDSVAELDEMLDEARQKAKVGRNGTGPIVLINE